MTPTQEATVVDTAVNVEYTAINTDRELHNEESSTYWLPKDDEEQKRLTGVSCFHNIKCRNQLTHDLLN
ncbi:hypothetical protein G6F68_021206 [Rhizopus microsporus]|nr:hypothetical protein G6F68_021206 [Rhizopus microsporus]